MESKTQKCLNTDSLLYKCWLPLINNCDNSPLGYKGENCSHVTMKRSGVGPARQTASVSVPVQAPSLSASPPREPGPQGVSGQRRGSTETFARG